MANETWNDSGEEVADPSMTGAFVRGRRPLGRTTVLPRVDRDGDVSHVVHPKEARYEQNRELGRGGIGVVMGARDVDIGREVAIKQIRHDLKSEKALLRFAEEIRTIGMLDHPNIIPIHDVGEDETGAPYFVMKYVDGPTLKDVLDDLRNGKSKAHAHWTFARRLDVFKKVLDAVAYAHHRGVVHRDLKPENIMVGSHGEVHVLDWGIAHRKALPDLSGLKGRDPIIARTTQTKDGVIMGTPSYMSPEQARGQPADATSDIYSLGVILFEWLTLRHYLSGITDLEELLEGVQNLSVPDACPLENPLQPNVPAELGWMAVKAVQKNPKERYPSIDAWIEAFDDIADGDIPIHCPVTFQKHWLARLDHFINQYPYAAIAGMGGILVMSGVGLLGLTIASFSLGAVLF